MRVIIVLGLALIASVSSSVVIDSYHDTIGIPLAAKILADQEIQSADPFDERIVGGVLAPAGSHPYFAGLWIDIVGVSGGSVCGATLLSANRLVTAAHCWRDGTRQAWRFNVILGTKRLSPTGIATSNVVTHPQYMPSLLHNDVAMIYLPYNVIFSTTVQPVALPLTSESLSTFEGQTAVATGFGKTSDMQSGAQWDASHVALRVISNQLCSSRFGTSFVIGSTLCTSGAEGASICGGDSGGPLVLEKNGRSILIGISSFVAQTGCQIGEPAGFARVTSFLSFINQHL